MSRWDWERVFPEMAWIGDARLRANVSAVYDEAMEIGGWESIEELEKLPFLIRDPGFGGTLVQHIRFVTQLSRAACDAVAAGPAEGLFGYRLNRDYVVAGALLHDVAKVFAFEVSADGQYRKSMHEKLLRHCYSGAGLAMKHGLPEMVVHIIAVHAPEGDLSSRCPEAVIVNKSDFLALDMMTAAKEFAT